MKYGVVMTESVVTLGRLRAANAALRAVANEGEARAVPNALLVDAACVLVYAAMVNATTQLLCKSARRRPGPTTVSVTEVIVMAREGRLSDVATVEMKAAAAAERVKVAAV